MAKKKKAEQTETPIVEESRPSLSAAEALYGVFGWLTTRKEPAGPFGAAWSTAPAAEIIKAFIEANQLAGTRKDYPRGVVMPKGDFDFDNTAQISTNILSMDQTPAFLRGMIKLLEDYRKESPDSYPEQFRLAEKDLAEAATAIENGLRSLSKK